MRQLLTACSLVAALTVSGGVARAHDAYSDAEAQPLKIMSYPVAAAGFVVEWMVTRPIHFLVSQPTLQKVFNYEPSYNAFDTPEPYLLRDAEGTRPLPPGTQIIEPPQR